MALPISSSASLIFCLVIIMFVPTTLSTTYTVGDTTGWTMGTDYSTWTSGKTFKVGDSLVFNYPSGHTVDEVSGSDYNTCTVGNAITTDSSGATTVALKTAGTHYFICGVVGHCGGGMKLSLKVAAAGSAAPTTTTSPASPSSGDTSSTTSPATGTATPSTNRPASNMPDSSSIAGTVSPWIGVVISLVVVVIQRYV
ncbi:Blue copper protein [Linum perenne]